MKKTLLSLLTLVLAVIMCLGLSGCGTLKQLENEYGALIEGGGFKKGSTLNLNEIPVTEETANEVLEQLAKSGISIDDESKAYIYDIFVTNKKNEEVQPDGTVKVTIPAPADEKAEGYNVYHIKDSGAIENIPATLANGKITFETDGFSTYIIVPQYNVCTFYWNTEVTIELTDGGKVQLDGTEYTETANVSITPASVVALKAIPDAGFKFAGWVISAEGAATATVAEAEYEYTMPYDNVKITASFKPIITSIEVVGINDVYEYDPALLPELETISIDEFINNGEKGKVYNVAGRVATVDSGRIMLIDNYGNYIYVKLGNTYKQSLVNDYFMTHSFKEITVTGTKGDIESGHFTLKNPTLHPVKENFESAMVRGYSDVGTSRLKLGVDYEIIGEVNWEKAGEYVVVYRLIDDHSVYENVTVKVLGDVIEFGAYVEGGTILIDGADIGPDFWEEYKDGFVKLTLTAKGEPNTVFKGWYTDEDTPRLISTESIYTFEFDTDTRVVGVFEYIPTGLTLDGDNAGFNTREDVTVIRLPANRTYNVNNILVYAIANGEPVWLEPGTYTVDAGGFNGASPVKGSYTLTFSYRGIVKTHVIKVIDPADMAYFGASAQAGGRVESNQASGEYNKGEQITVTVQLRSESDYEFLGWYTMDASGAIGTTCLSTERTYSFTLNTDTYIIAKVEPKITRLEVEGYEGEPTRIHISKFWLADREIGVYACGALGKRVELTANEYTVDMGGLDLNNPAVGKYTVTYTYKADTSITYSVNVFVYNEDHSFLATQDSPDNGWLIFDGELTHEAGGQYAEGEEVTVVAAAKEGYTFLGWYRVIDRVTHCEYELITTDATYTFTIDKDTVIEAKFGAPVTSIDLSGVGIDNYGRYFIEAFKGERISLSNICVWASSLIEYRNLNSDEYAIDLGGLNLNDAAAGVYTVTYTYKEDGKLTDVTVTLTVNVRKHVYSVIASVDGGDGYVEYEGKRDQFVCADAEEGSRVILKAGVYDTKHRVFLRWETYNYDEDVWELYSTDSSISVIADGNVKLRAVFGGIVRELHIHEKTNLYEKGVYHWNFDRNTWNEELGRYEEQGNFEISIDSEYANDIVGLFANFNIVAVETNGRHTVINASDLVIDLGDYKAEEGWYEITVSYGTLVMTVNVMVVPAYN